MLTDLTDYLPLLLWCAAGVTAAWVLLPPLLGMIGLSRFRHRGEAGPADLAPPDDDPHYADTYRQLEALGFRPLGTYEERVTFFGSHWVWSVSERVFGSKELGCAASVYRFFPGEPMRVAMVSCAADGAMLWTGNRLADMVEHDHDYQRWGVVTDDMARLLGRHREEAKRFLDGRACLAHDDLGALVPVLARHSREQGLKASRALGGWTLKLALFFVAVPTILAWMFFGCGSLAVPVSVVLGAAAKVLFDKFGDWCLTLPCAQEEEPDGDVIEDCRRG